MSNVLTAVHTLFFTRFIHILHTSGIVHLNDSTTAYTRTECYTVYGPRHKTRRYRCARYLLRLFDFLLFYLETMWLFFSKVVCALSFDMFAKQTGEQNRTRNSQESQRNNKLPLQFSTRDRHRPWPVRTRHTHQCNAMKFTDPPMM